MSNLIIMSGIPGAGKTTYAKAIPNAKVISNDDIRFSLTHGVFLDQKEWNQLPIVPIQEHLINEASKTNQTVVLDCTSLTNSIRANLYYKYQSLFDRVSLVVLNPGLLVSIARNYQRDKVVPLAQILNMYNIYEDVNEEILSLYDDVKVF